MDNMAEIGYREIHAHLLRYFVISGRRSSESPGSPLALVGICWSVVGGEAL